MAEGEPRASSTGSRASQLVEDAASILEEELLVTGIDVARNIEGRLFGDERPSRDAVAVLTNLRRDAHEIVDLAADLLDRAMDSFGDVAGRVVAIREDADAAEDGAGPVPTLVAPDATAAGESASVAMAVENESEQPTETFELTASDLVSPAGDRIAADRVAFEPAAMTIPPRQAERIEVTVEVPADTPPGRYSGLLQATKLDPVRAVLVVDVV